MRYIRIPLYLQLGALLFPFSLAAQPGMPNKLTLKEALDYARQYSPLLQAAREDIQAAKGTEVTAGLRPNPEVDLNSESYPLFESAPGSFWNGQELTLSVGQTVETGRKRYWRQRVASVERESVESQADDVQRLVKLRVQQAFSEVLLAQADLDSARQLLADFDKILAINKSRFEKGRSPGETCAGSRSSASGFSMTPFNRKAASPTPKSPCGRRWVIRTCEKTSPPRVHLTCSPLSRAWSS